MLDKKVILCEGVHEVLFLSQLLKNQDIQYSIITKEQLQNTPIRSPQSYFINDFLRPRNCRQKFLLKDEGGDKRCILSFTLLYEDKDNRFLMMLCLDRSPKNLEYLRETTKKRFGGDILNQYSHNSFTTKDQFKHRIFFIPESLEQQIHKIIGKTIDGKTHDEIIRILNDFINKCRELEISWFFELETFLFSKEL